MKTAAVAGLLLVLPSAAGADDDGERHDHELARELHERGEIKPLSAIMQIVGQKMPGDIVAIELVALDNRWVYRFQVVTGEGRRVFVDVDAGARPPAADRDDD